MKTVEFLATCEFETGDDIASHHGGRYLDRFEKRGDDWRIAFRRVIGDWHRTDIVAAAGWDSFVLGRFPARNIGTTIDDPSVALLAGHWL